MVWNSGARTVRGENIASDDPLRVELGDGAVVLDARVLKMSKPATKCAVRDNKGPNNSILLAFDFLDSRQGFLVEIFHTESGEVPRLSGTVQEMPQGFKDFGKNYPGPLPFIAAMILTAVGGASLCIWVFANFFVMEWTLTKAIGRILIFAFGILLTFTAAGVAYISWRHYPNSLKMPEFRE